MTPGPDFYRTAHHPAAPRPRRAAPRPDARRLPPLRELPALFHEACHPGRLPTGINLSTPWIETGTVYASDGALLVAIPCRRLAPEVVAALPVTDATRPTDMGGRLQGLGAGASEPIPLPTVDQFPDQERPPCRRCGGRAFPLVGAGVTSSPCPACGGTGVHRTMGSGIIFGGGDRLTPRFGVDGWYLTLLRRHGATLYPPARLLPRPGPFPFEVEASGVYGYVQPLLFPK